MWDRRQFICTAAGGATALTLDSSPALALEKPEPLLSVPLNTTVSQTLDIHLLENYEPETIPGHKINVSARELAGFIYSEPRFNMKHSLKMTDPRTGTFAGIDVVAEYVDNHLKRGAGRVLLDVLQIEDYTRLTPKEAIILANGITARHMDYSDMQRDYSTRVDNSEKARKEYQRNDGMSVHEVLENPITIDGNGVCRNYAEVVWGVFEALKLMQDSETSLLKNTYCLTSGFEDWQEIPGFVEDHAWNSFATITPDSVDVTVVDITAGDSRGWPLTNEDTSSAIDRTYRRKFVPVMRAKTNGLIATRNVLDLLKSELSFSKKYTLELKSAIDHYESISRVGGLSDALTGNDDSTQGISNALQDYYGIEIIFDRNLSETYANNFLKYLASSLEQIELENKNREQFRGLNIRLSLPIVGTSIGCDFDHLWIDNVGESERLAEKIITKGLRRQLKLRQKVDEMNKKWSCISYGSFIDYGDLINERMFSATEKWMSGIPVDLHKFRQVYFREISNGYSNYLISQVNGLYILAGERNNFRNATRVLEAYKPPKQNLA